MTVEQNEYIAALPMILSEVEVASVARVSPSFVRIELSGPVLAEFGTPGPVFDQRIKIVFPNASGTLPSFADADESWWTTWIEIPEDERGSMRTYTVRDVVGEGTDTRLVVDIVVHESDPHHTDDTDPLDGAGNRWALQAQVGQRLIVMAPRRGHEYGGIEWAPGPASRLLLVGDETAAPAIRGVLRDLPADATGAAFLEVPLDADVLDDVAVPPGVELTWLPRNGGARGEDLHAAVLAHLTGTVPTEKISVADDEIDPDLWETPVYSSSGEDLAEATDVPTEGAPYAGLYAWIAGESKVVTGLRRKLVNDLGLDRKQVAFMGYWREGVSMRS
ncbi:siderophore-interacting protein [Nocardioides sp. Root190]|uniref:siderophore-interacting protein n=1 Tax=Nocardioides sp. Root190 TaxID=1736488 RepID=UPI000AC65073|nr:siderophore-interacting protein [Nocardioides sp. Root190]